VQRIHGSGCGIIKTGQRERMCQLTFSMFDGGIEISNLCFERGNLGFQRSGVLLRCLQ
jgi:hypothetical protein